MSVLKSLRLLSDPNRLRLLLLLEREELSVAELQEIIATGQSRISTHLAQLKQAGLVEDRKQGKNSLYRLKDRQIVELLHSAAGEIREAKADAKALQLVLEKRRDKVRGYFDELAGKFGRNYVPGRSWKGLAEMLLQLMPPMTIGDLGAGEGTFSQLLAQRAARVIAVDNSAKMVEVGAKLARDNGIANLEYRLGDLENPPIDPNSLDLTFFSQSLHHALHPQEAVNAAYRLLKPGGRIVILDLKRHTFEQARELYADTWLGFSEVELRAFLEHASFTGVQSWIVDREKQTPAFETILAVGTR
ncbi:MAG TPA: metalloregulator ArsR/SmtB family transcription factor [Bryobacteraceae bacterium]|jgi:ArsR family transcriptional regulator|nr:metalloregulator ArsR/SmtB family transcription factor [Bryobacteraceae bacterium]